MGRLGRRAGVAQLLAGPTGTHRSLQKVLQPNPNQTTAMWTASQLACVEVCDLLTTPWHRNAPPYLIYFQESCLTAFSFVFPFLSCLVLFSLKTSLSPLSSPILLQTSWFPSQTPSRQVSFLSIYSSQDQMHFDRYILTLLSAELSTRHQKPFWITQLLTAGSVRISVWEASAFYFL